MRSDPLSDILKLTRADSLLTGGFTAGGSWAIRFPVPTTIKFFAVVKGHCWVHIDGEAAPMRFDVGDVGLLSARCSFVVASNPGVDPVEAMSLFSAAGKSTAQIGNGEDFSYIGGHVRLDPVSGDLLADALPPWFHIQAHSPDAATFRWLLSQMLQEKADARPGAHLAAAQLAQLLFIQILRDYMKDVEGMPQGWLRAMCDRRIAPALTLMHGDPARTWHLDELASACAMSRTTFAVRFKTAAGIAPLTYLSDWRMRLAKRALQEQTKSVATIAQSLGYASESAFSNAFKRNAGRSPRAYRTEQGHKNGVSGS